MLDNLGELAKPVTVLFEKIAEATGALWAPRQIKRLAAAEGEAKLIKFEFEQKLTEREKRALHMAAQREALHLGNMEAIMANAAPLIRKDAKPGDIEKDWMANFWERAKVTSDQDMQNLWSQVLAGEANAPGTYRRRTVNALADMEKADAEEFTKFCSFVWMREVPIPLIFEVDHPIYSENGISYDGLMHLDSIGLVEVQALGLLMENLPQEPIVYSYFGKDLEITIPEGADLPCGLADLTKVGQELFPICGSVPVDGYYDYVKRKWAPFLPKKKTMRPREKRSTRDSGNSKPKK